ncbi:uncharacterized protein LOC113359853 [Papaver somniferum]|uniref:uncharacterized protein LOC113359853 n=1 Tax=Papaver somniferum TaxID=3469 RepID=UPI000E6FD165|nr:uncharacterized protein LOC113359853 [Papaver somniferum]
MRVLFWNINGVAREAAQSKLRVLIREFKPDVFCIAEPKVVCSANFGRRLQMEGYSPYIIRNASLSNIANLWICYLDGLLPSVVNMSRQAITIAVEDSWNAPAHGSPDFIFPYKMKRLKVVMKEWNLRVFGNIHSRLKHDQLRFETAARNSDEDAGDIPKLNAMKDSMTALSNTRQHQAIMLKQKSRNQWLIEGSSNTTFFHNNIRIRRSDNTISELVDAGGVTITDYDQLRDHAVQYYEDKFNGQELDMEENLFDFEHPSISAEQSLDMDEIPTPEEIKQVVFEIGSDSAPGPDGFSGCFYRHCWGIIQDDLTKSIIYCWNSGHIPNSVNSSLIILLAKILATRLSSVLDKLVSEEHVAFMKGRNIHENISLASELVNELHIKRKDGNLGLKLDISQAFDTGSWWCNWLLDILSSARISILLNGNPEGYFKINIGLRQGDPLSPLIFVLIEDVLSRNITKLFRDKKMTPLVTQNGISPTHLIFADDIMIFCKGNLKSVHNLIDLLGKYQAALGQTVCRQKSKIYYGGGSLSMRTYLVDILGMSVATFPDRYLGVQIMPGTVRYHHICNVIERIKAQLAGWKGRLLSFHDCIVLVKSVIVSYSIHNMAVYKWPRKFILQCERAIRNFIWTGDSNISHAVVVAFDKVCCPYEEGGLGLTRMATMNKALIMKLWWKIRNSKKKWVGFLRAKFFGRNGCIKKYGVKSTIFPGIRWVHQLVENNTRVLLGDGRNTTLYYDIWCTDVCLAEILNDQTLERTIMLGDFWNGDHWVFPAIHLERLAAAGVDVNQLPTITGGEESMVWMPDLKGNFSVSSAKELIRKKISSSGGDVFNLEKRVKADKGRSQMVRDLLLTANLDYSGRLKGYMKKTSEDIILLDYFRVCHRKVKMHHLVECYWHPPDLNEIQLCCDGAARRNPGRAGAGVVERDSSCNVIGAMFIGLGVTTNYLAELYDTMAKRGCYLDNEVGMHYDGRPPFQISVEYPNVAYYRFK